MEDTAEGTHGRGNSADPEEGRCSDSDFGPSKLGTREYWEDAYQKELETFKDIGDVGEIWFGEESMSRVLRWMDKAEIPENAAILDIGTGNAAFLVELAKHGYRNLTGIDYSPASVELARNVLQAEDLTGVTVKEVDFLNHQGELKDYDVCIDKGTFDAISLNPHNTEEGKKLYVQTLKDALKDKGFFAVTSCNWTKEQLLCRFSEDGCPWPSSAPKQIGAELHATMVIILSKTLEKKKGVSDVRSKNIERRLCELHTMSKGTTLFSCGTVEANRWLDLGRSCAIQQRAPCQPGASLESLWDVMPEQGSQHWAKDQGSATAITSLIRDLSLSNCSVNSCHSHTTSATAHFTTTPTSQAPTAPPSKRQCRSLSFSDEYSGFRSSWRPQGSRVWTAVEKRRCHSGGSVRGGGGFSGGHFPTIQRSSSFSLPSCSRFPSDGALDLPFFNQRLPLHPQFSACPVSPTSPSSHHHHSRHHHFLRPLSLSHEQISLPELQREEASEASSPDSTPELGRRAGQRAGGTGCLSRSRSQPCVLNDKKIGMKRRRPEDAQEQRPSLDLAKMTQKLETFQSLSCPRFTATNHCQSSLPLPSSKTSSQPDSDFAAVSELELESQQEVAGDDEDEDSCYEELDSDSACSVDSRSGSPAGIVGGKRNLWKGDCLTQRDIFQLGGELDLDQIERN
ncbi:putative protein FAM53B-like [Scophthalmus maximus]|uniref:EEF1A lysine methyltransferase 2 n=1 Tax=Scophthalmus maximus TaxID=52904 RepID=A0A2U9CCC0_SCOMX|nr:putative protein FAM53B-like [Scophthalmus maximus]